MNSPDQSVRHLLPTNLDPQAMRQSAAKATALLKVLANESRLMILCALAEGEATVSKLNEQVDLSQSALSQHLAILRQQGLVQTRKAAQMVYYSLTPSDALPVISTLHEIYCPID